jgi:hypothetical protein
LANEFQAALKSGDIEGAEKLVRWGNAPVEAYRLFRMSLADCLSPAKCSVKTAPMSDEEKAGQANYFFSPAPEGQLVLKDAENNEGFKLPFAKINGSYQVILGNVTKVGRDRILESANPNNFGKELAPDVIEEGVKLPANGGEQFEAYREYSQAVARKDKVFLATKGTEKDRFFFSKFYSEKPVKEKIALELTRLENLVDPIFEDGFVLENRAVLMLKGKSGLGWDAVGAVALTKEAGVWGVNDKIISGIPPVE